MGVFIFFEPFSTVFSNRRMYNILGGGDFLVVYVDVLIAINTIIDYFLIKITEHFLKSKSSVLRHILASVLGGFSSLYIFLNGTSALVDFFFQCTISFFIVIICFYEKNFKKIFFSFLILQTVTCCYTGFAILFVNYLDLKGMIVNNSIVYYKISPIVLIVGTAAFYLVFSVLHLVFTKNAVVSEKCTLSIWANGKCIETTAIIDTGNSIEDAMSNSEVIITNDKNIYMLFGENAFDNFDLKNRYRKIPCSTISGECILEGLRCDFCYAVCDNKKVKLEKPILVVSKTQLCDEYEAIINPRIFL